MDAERRRRINSAVFREFGEPVRYLPKGGDPVETRVIPRITASEAPQPSAPGFFAHVEVDPEAVPSPGRKDEVVWADGTFYVVASVRQGVKANPIVALHRKGDA